MPPLRAHERRLFNFKRNPFYRHARVRLFLARSSGRIVGRVAGIDDTSHNLIHDDNLCFFGFFEAESAPVARALLSAVENWAYELGRNAVRGPVNPSMNHSCGLQVDAFDKPPYIMMPYNPPEYPEYITNSKYAKIKDLYAWLGQAETGMPQRITRLVERIRSRYQPVIRPLNMRKFSEDFNQLKKIYRTSWEKNWGFVPYSDEEFDWVAKDLKNFIDPDIALFAEVNGKTAGLAIALPDCNQALKKLNGRLFPFGWLRLLREIRNINQVRLPILGVLPEYRFKGLELVLIQEFFARGTARGYVLGECSWVLEDNRAMNEAIKAAGCILYKTYRLYQKSL